MKIKIFIAAFILIALTVFIAIPKSVYQKWFGRSENVTEVQDNRDSICVFVVDSDNRVVGVNVKVDKLEEDVIKQKWDLLTSKINYLPSGYSSAITPSTSLLKYEQLDGKLIFNVSDDINRSSGKLTIDSIAWTFCDDEIKEVVLKVDDVTINKINDYSYNHITKSSGINNVFETSYLFESDYTTIVKYEKDYILPVTYFHSPTDKYEYVLNKLIFNENNELVSYQYEVKDEVLVVSFIDSVNLSENDKKSIEETIKLNFKVDSFSLNSASQVIYENTFAKVE